jgi:DNA-binding transcriptional LysR family regulator
MMEALRWRGVQLRQLEALVAVASERSFVRAARRLGYSQSAVSHQIAALERTVGRRLLERPSGNSPVAVTDAGAVVLGHAEAVLARLGAARCDLDALAGGARRVRVGCAETTVALLPEAVCALGAPPAVELAQHRDSADLLDAVARGNVDAALVQAPAGLSGLRSEVVSTEPHVVVANRPLALDADAIARSPRAMLVGDAACALLEARFAESDAAVAPTTLVPSMAALSSLVATGLVLGIVPAAAARAAASVLVAETAAPLPVVPTALVSPLPA